MLYTNLLQMFEVLVKVNNWQNVQLFLLLFACKNEGDVSLQILQNF